MDTEAKLAQLGDAASYDVASTATRKRTKGAAAVPGICHTAGAGAGGSLLRVLMSDRCVHDCSFCPLRASAPRRRTAFTPDELARTFTQLHSAGHVDGLYLSSAVEGTADAAMDSMLGAVERLRVRDGFDGYVHLKLLPGAADSIVEEAARLASRVSINVEVPTGAYLNRLGTGKDMARDILRPMRLLHKMEQEGLLPNGITTQYVVGAAGESDREIVDSVRWLTSEVGLRRAYFGTFYPAPGTPLEEGVATHPSRPARLYQAEWLSRIYGLADADIDAAFNGGGDLPLSVDPKVAAALAQPARFPLDVNTASPEDLLRVPGIGPVSSRRIISLRRAHRFTTVEQLKKAGVAVGRALPFILIDGRAPEGAAIAASHLARLRAAPPSEFGVQLALPGLV